MQGTKTLKAEIIALLDFLPSDSLNMLAEFAAFLGSRSGAAAEDMSAMKPETSLTIREAQHYPLRISSPHIVNREQVADFNLEIIEETS